MLPSHYVRFVDGAGIGKISKRKRHAFFKKVKKHIHEEYEYPVYTSVLEEVASCENKELGIVNIMTDDRHCWRKNAKDTSVVAI